MRTAPPAAGADVPAAVRVESIGAVHDTVRGAVAASVATVLPAGGRIAIALSGGRDSIALIDAALSVAADTRTTVTAIHVHHGLSVHAGAWARFCVELCAARGVPLTVREVEVERGPRISVEAAAREVRYAALADAATEQRALAVLLAHHAGDQAETTLLQLFRGAGPRGLAAMPGARLDAGLWWLRPFLALPRARLDDYARERGLRYVDDDSNTDPRHRRNALRHLVPALCAIAPGYPTTLVRAAALQAEAAELLDDLARIDAGDAYDGASLASAAVARLDPRRAGNLVRWFLHQQRLPPPSRARLAEIVRQLACADTGARIAIAHAGAELGVHRGRIVVHRLPGASFSLVWDGSEAIALPHGTLRIARTSGSGMAARHASAKTVTIRSGVDGERLRRAGHAARRRVADLLREAGVPRWERRWVPRIYCGEMLVAVVPLGVDAAFAAAAGEPGFSFEWQPEPWQAV